MEPGTYKKDGYNGAAKLPTIPGGGRGGVPLDQHQAAESPQLPSKHKYLQECRPFFLFKKEIKKTKMNATNGVAITGVTAARGSDLAH